MPRIINVTTQTAIVSDHVPVNNTIKVQVSGLAAANSAKVDVRAKVDLGAPYKTMHTFRAASEAPRCFVAYPFMEFELRDNDAGNQVDVWVD